MEMSSLTGELDLEFVVGSPDTVVTGGYASDLLSDVMAHAAEGDALITVQAHNNTVAVADHCGIPAVIICNGRTVPADMAEAARANGITLCRTPATQFRVSGVLYTLLGSHNS